MEPIIWFAVLLIFFALIFAIISLFVLRETRNDPKNESGFIWLMLSIIAIFIGGAVAMIAAVQKDQVCRMPISGKKVKHSVLYV